LNRLSGCSGSANCTTLYTSPAAQKFAGAFEQLSRRVIVRDNLLMVRPSWLSSLLVLFSASAAIAQSAPAAGVRAAGMGGAFTAVADDATAAAWNPAAFASGSFASLALDGSSYDRQSSLFAGLGTPPLGFSYFRAATDGPRNGRNSLVAHNLGVSLVQSLGDTGVAVGTTLKLVHGVVTGGGSSSATNAFDADVGVMVSGSLGQIGLTVHNVARPRFAAPDSESEIRLDRRVRGGVAVHLMQRTTLAADVEFTKSQTFVGAWRDAAVGIEARPAGSIWIRGGVHWNTGGGDPGGSGAAPIGCIGGSYALRRAVLADVQASLGSSRGNRGWGAGLRFVF
jgi:hypothetical protein